MKREKKLQNQLWKERMPLIASFFLPFFILTVICILHDVYPFGEQCILHIDMYHQYCPFFTELMDKIKHGGSMFYSWNIGLGADFISLYAYYLASPLNWLLLLCPQNHVIEFMTLLVILKISLAGLFFGYYLKEHFEKNHAAISIFATAYALCGFSAAYAWDIMWLDCMMLAPLVVLGLEQLIKEKKVLLYYISLSLCIISNYYIAIMVCIFQVIWFVITWLENKETGIGAWIRFAIYSLLAGGTGAILIIPEAITLGASGSQNISFPDTMEWYFNIIAELGRHSVMTEPYTGKDHWPNIYCGVFVLLLFVLYLFNREISWKKKLSRGLLAAFFVISFSNNILDFIWHGMHFPDSLPGRQTFLYAFLMLAVSYEAFLHFKGTRFLDVIAAGVASVGLMAVSCHFSDGTILGESAATATYVFLGSYIVVLLIYFYAEECIREDVVKKIGKIKKATREELKKIMLDKQFGGLEFLCSIPGVVGGSVKTNAGCFGCSVGDVIVEAQIIDGVGEIKTVPVGDLLLSYRSSFFPDDWIILSITFRTSPDSAENIRKKLDEQKAYRMKNQPYNQKTAGSTFKNPEGLRAWELIKKSGCAGLQVGGAKVSDIHCNFLINTGKATAADIETLGETIIKKVREETTVTLEWEIKRLGINK